MDDDDLHPVVRAVRTILGAAIIAFSLWCTVIAFTGGRLPAIGSEMNGGVSNGLVWIFVLDPIVLTVGYWVLLIIVLPLVAIFPTRLARSVDANRWDSPQVSATIVSERNPTESQSDDTPADPTALPRSKSRPSPRIHKGRSSRIWGRAIAVLLLSAAAAGLAILILGYRGTLLLPDLRDIPRCSGILPDLHNGNASLECQQRAKDGLSALLAQGVLIGLGTSVFLVGVSWLAEKRLRSRVGRIDQGRSLVAELGRIADLHRDGALTDAEFTIVKQRLLDR
jgi:hypothetical protein